jgi:hypothetical protein
VRKTGGIDGSTLSANAAPIEIGSIPGTVLCTNPTHKCYDYQYKMSKLKKRKGIHHFDGEEAPA